MRRWVKVSCIASAALSAAAATLPWWLPTGWIRERIETEASAALGTKVSVGSLSLFWTGTEIRDLRVEDPSGAPEPLLAVREARASIALPLLSGRIENLQVVVDGLAVSLVQGPDGRWNAQRLAAAPGGKEAGPAAPPSPAGPEIPYSGKITLKNGSVRLAPAGSAPIEIARLDATVDLNLGKDPVAALLSLSIPSLYGGGTLTVDARSDLSAASAEIRAEGGAVSLSADASAEGLQTPAALRARLKGTVAGDLAAIPFLAPAGLQGRFSRAFSATYGPEGLTLDQEGSVDGLALAAIDLPPARVDALLSAEAAFQEKGASVRLKDLKVRCAPPGIELSGAGSAEGISAEAPFLDRIDLSLTARLTEAGAAKPLDERFSVKSLDATIGVKGTPRKLESEGRLSAAGIRLAGTRSGRSFEIPSLSYSHRLAADPQARSVDLESLSLSAGFLSLSAKDGAFRWNGGAPSLGLSASFQADVAKVSEILAAIGPPGLPSASGSLSGSARIEGGGEAAAVDLSLRLDGGALRLADGATLPLGSPVAGLKGRLHRGLAGADLDEVRAETYGISLRAAPLSIDPAGPSPVAIRGGTVEARLTDLATTAKAIGAAGLLPEGLALGGKLSLRLSSVDADLSSGKASLALEGEGLEASGGPVPFPLAEKALSVKGDLAWRLGKGVSLAAREIGIESAALRATVRDLSAEAGDGPLRLAASIPALSIPLGSSAARAALSGVKELDLSGMAEGKGLSVRLDGDRIRAEGTLDLTSSGLRFGPAGDPLARKEAGAPLTVAAKAEGDLAAARWKVESLEAATPAGALRLKGEAKLAPALSGSATLDTDALDLAKLGGMLPPLAKAGASGTVKLSGSAGLDGAVPTASIEAVLAKVRLAPEGAEPLAVDGTLRYALKDDGSDRLEAASLAVETMDQRGDLSLDLAGLWKAAQAVQGGKPEAPLNLAPVLAAIRGTVSAKLPSYAFQKNKVSDLSLLLKATGEAIEIAPLSAKVNQGTFEAKGALRAAGEHRLDAAVRKVDLDLESAKLLSYPLPMIPHAGGRVRCTADFTLAVLAQGLDAKAIEASLRTPERQRIVLLDGSIEGSALLKGLADKLEDTSLATLKFTRLEAEFEVANRVVTVHRARLDGDLTLEMSGTTSFDGTYDHRVKILGKLAEGDSVTARLLRAANESGGIRVKGTLAGSPSIDLDKGAFARKLAEEELKRRLEQEAKDRTKDAIKDNAGDILKDIFKKRK